MILNGSDPCIQRVEAASVGDSDVANFPRPACKLPKTSAAANSSRARREGWADAGKCGCACIYLAVALGPKQDQAGAKENSGERERSAMTLYYFVVRYDVKTPR